MSSPIAKYTQESNFVHKCLVYFHRKISHKKRIEILSDKLAAYFNEIVGDKKDVTCIDVGCGDLGIMERITEKVPGTIWKCLDIYDLPDHLKNNPKWGNYIKFNGRDLPFRDDSIDVVLFCDMLHHAYKNIKPLLKEAHRVGKKIVIKDSFEYSSYSRWVLKFMDFIGNWGYGVAIPEKYFTVDDFKCICKELGLRINRLDIGIQIYGHLPIIKNILQPKWHFIAVLESM